MCYPGKSSNGLFKNPYIYIYIAEMLKSIYIYIQHFPTFQYVIIRVISELAVVIYLVNNKTKKQQKRKEKRNN